MRTWLWKNKFGLIAIILVVLGTRWAVQRLHKPGQLDVIAAQAMDMSAMRPPAGVALVDLAEVRQGALNATVTYTGSVQAFNEQEIAPRVTGRLVALPAYPGDRVRAGQLLAQLDTAELSAKADQAAAQARQAKISEQVAHLTHHWHHQAAIDQATAQVEAAEQAVQDAKDQTQAARDGVADAEAGIESAQANADYWKAEIAREKQLYDAGAVSRQEYQNEVAQELAAQAALRQARAKASQARAMQRSASAKVAQALKQVSAARSAKRMAVADKAIAAAQANEANANADAARAAAREAEVVQQYTRIVSPANGVVTARLVAPGTLVQPGMAVLKVAEIDRVRVQANVAVADLGGIGVGSPVAIGTVGGTENAAINAHVTAVFPAANDQTRTAVVETVVPNPGHRLLPGSFVTVRISKSGGAGKLLVPAESIVYEGGQPYVWVARGSAAAPAAQPAGQYRATGCGMLYSAADAKKYNYVCPMDKSKLVPVTPAAPTQYKATGCGMLYSAADAKKYNYICPMDKSKLVPVTPSAAPSNPSGPLTVHRVNIQTGASDGTWTEATGEDLRPDDHIVRHGQAGLAEGAKVSAVPWGPDGPKAMPNAAQVSGGETRYRCEVCGLTFSAEDAKKNNYKDPMEGGKLVPIK